MGLLDDLAGEVLGGGTARSNLMNEVMGMLNNQQSGGLSGLIQQFSGKGLGDIIGSWVGTGENLPVTPQQIQQALGSDTVKQLAAKAGLSNNEVTSQLSELLPQVVDKLTPNGKVPSGDIMSKGMDILKVLLR